MRQAVAQAAFAIAAFFLISGTALAQAPPVSVFTGRLTPLGYCQMTVNTSTQLSACTGGIPAGATTAVVVVATQAIRYRTDGTEPTAAIGMPVAVGTEKIFTLTDLNAIRVIAQVAGAVVNVEFFR